jgi:hypothetical protein
MFFSEEKNQKTFNSALADGCRPWPDRWEAAESYKSFGSFLQKRTCFRLSIYARNSSAPGHTCTTNRHDA